MYNRKKTGYVQLMEIIIKLIYRVKRKSNARYLKKYIYMKRYPAQKRPR